MITKGQALAALCPGAEWSILGGEVTWLDSTTEQPSEVEIIEKIVELEYLAEINDYKNKRAAEYPPYSDYLDGLVKNDQEQIDAYITACQSVKDKYPKIEIDYQELSDRQRAAIAELEIATEDSDTTAP